MKTITKTQSFERENIRKSGYKLKYQYKQSKKDKKIRNESLTPAFNAD